MPEFVSLDDETISLMADRSAINEIVYRPDRPFRKMATGRAHGATFRSRGADSESSHLISILRAADGSNF